MLNYDVERDIDRVTHVKEELKEKAHPSTRTLEQMGNYILFGKDANGESDVDRGLIQIETKHKSYKRKDSNSLEELLESPTFDEQILKPVHRSVYTNPKPSINREAPELAQLREEIDKTEQLYSRNPTYALKHYLIALKTEQYTIWDCVHPRFQKLFPQKSTPIFNLDIDILPLGAKNGELKRFTEPYNLDQPDFTPSRSTLAFDFENETHVKLLLDAYSLLFEQNLKLASPLVTNLIDTLNFYIEKANLTSVRRTILKGKMQKCSNAEISAYLEKNHEIKYNVNYISTLYTHEIVPRICAAATLHKREWQMRHYPKYWKRCKCCGKLKLMDEHEFGPKAAAKDGIKDICKKCEEKAKEEKKKC